jgi:hypothetical protein
LTAWRLGLRARAYLPPEHILPFRGCRRRNKFLWQR